MDSDNTIENDPQKTGRRARTRMVTLYTGEHIRAKVEKGKAFRMGGGGVYALQESGAFVRLDKDPRSAKERKRARRESRQGKT